MEKVKAAILLLTLIFLVIGCVEDETPTKLWVQARSCDKTQKKLNKSHGISTYII